MRARKVSPVISSLVRTALRACEGVRFHPGPTCISCGGTLSGYDEREKRFAILVEEDQPRAVQVVIQRAYCHDCGKIICPEEPFYPGTRIGSPVVDLCRSLSATMPCSRASSVLGSFGIVVDRWSVRHYACMQLPEVPAVEVFGVRIPASVVVLSSLPRPGSEPLNPAMEDILAACNYPSGPPAGISPSGNPATARNPGDHQRIIDAFVKGFSRSLGIVVICSGLLAAIFSGAAYIPDGLIGSACLDIETMSIQGFGCL